MGRERWIDRLLQAVKIWGSASSTFVMGIEMAVPEGFKTEDEAAESIIEGWKWLLAHGVSPGGTPWRPVPGTEFAGMPSPRTEFFLRMELQRHKMALERGLTRKGCSRCQGQTLSRDWNWVDFPREN